jgi:chemosensory pili system protein ChpA (sensor histidine kinase/response regulator)
MATLPQTFRDVVARGRRDAVSKPKVLVVDDDVVIRELLSLHLANGGYEPMVAEDPVVAGRIVVETAPDLIIVDINMPYMNGPEFVAALRTDPATRHIPVVFLTVDEDVMDHVAHLGAVAYLKKPVMADHLLSVVGRFIPA